MKTQKQLNLHRASTYKSLYFFMVESANSLKPAEAVNVQKQQTGTQIPGTVYFAMPVGVVRLTPHSSSEQTSQD